ncbi:GDP-mannose mannosyl hydrolase [Shewanella halifaxensis]|uniref:GDP-mannose mannosyl hydrolase n=1 Tax=Shewanella halifaxensis TaxID=271098 RepID=UPI000D59900A|nr:GDP-mannose mannosyl hydrolase [Shewanella halifaxensis]
MYLDKHTFTKVIDSTPLVSIDLVVENSKGEILLGLRNNRPAQGFWFVPGGRIRKNETMDNAFKRLCHEELGLDKTRQQAEWLGAFEHFYDDCVFGDTISTHYVVLAYKIIVDAPMQSLPISQHNQYKWLSVDKVLSDSKVHLHSKWYVKSTNLPEN